MEYGIAGLDLAGNEAQFPAEPFIGIFREAKQSGLKVAVHAGEWGGPENVRQAIEQFDADRIGHGVRVMEDEYTVTLAKDRQTCFEVCITSNYQTGAVKELSEHPLKKMIAAGLNVTLNTDDPSISQITLSNEYKVAEENPWASDGDHPGLRPCCRPFVIPSRTREKDAGRTAQQAA